jgi:carbon-monoxide dehydrogenase medium subunit
MLPPFALERPTTVGDAVRVLREDSVAYCGGTEILLAMKMGLLRPAVLVDLKGVPELRGIRVDGDNLVIGATVSHAEIARSELVESQVPLLAAVERRVGNARVRAQGSIGGNLCFAEPRSDIATVLIALNASLTLASPAGERTLPVADFLLGAYWTARADDELLVSVSVPLPAPNGAYEKFQIAERPTVGVAAVPAAGGGCRIVVGAAAELPLAVDVPDVASVDPVAIAERIEPVPDLTGSVRYKRHVVATCVRRALAALDPTGTNRENDVD